MRVAQVIVTLTAVALSDRGVANAFAPKTCLSRLTLPITTNKVPRLVEHLEATTIDNDTGTSDDTSRQTTTSSGTSRPPAASSSSAYDVVVIGSGLGGLSCAGKSS